jgi:hypothetical protein
MNVEWLMVADSGQIMNNKLYVLGDGWEGLAAQQTMPFRHKLSVALAILVGWTEANEPWDVQVELAFDDPRQDLASMNGELRVGRPVNLPIGRTQRVQYSLDLDVEFAQPGRYIVRARAGESDWRQVGFNKSDSA